MNDLLRKNNDQPTNIDVSCVQTVGLKHAKGLFVLLETQIEIFCNSSITANPRSERNSNLEYCDTLTCFAYSDYLQ
jgi:hypothetical protein